MLRRCAQPTRRQASSPRASAWVSRASATAGGASEGHEGVVALASAPLVRGILPVSPTSFAVGSGHRACCKGSVESDSIMWCAKLSAAGVALFRSGGWHVHDARNKKQSYEHIKVSSAIKPQACNRNMQKECRHPQESNSVASTPKPPVRLKKRHTLEDIPRLII